VLNLGYGFEGTLTPLKEFHFVSKMFTGSGTFFATQNPTPSTDSTAKKVPDPLGTTNRFAHTFLAHLPVPLPKNYLLGIDIQQHDFEDYGRPSYLRGEWRDHGWWYYYIYACAIKVPLALWLLAALTLFTRFFWLTANSQQLTAPWRDELILLFPAIFIFAVVSSKTGFSEHMRYVLPAFPYFFIWISQLARIFARKT
jgi:hypothetical protein